MTHVRFPDFSHPVPVHRPVAVGTVRLLPAPDRYRHNVPSATRNEPPPGEIEPCEAVEPVRPDTAHVRALQIMDVAGDLLVAFAIIGGGVLAYGFLPPL